MRDKHQFHAMIDEVPLALTISCVLPGSATFRGFYELLHPHSLWHRWPPLAALAAKDVRVAVDYSMVSTGTGRHHLQRVRETGEQLPLGYRAVGVVRAPGADTEPGGQGAAVGQNRLLNTLDIL
ncbi:hypothetical protein [Pseudomonas protegens]|uniref:hypothetical protein n=1 Tax=Pseudomonas protegens TaxID=380021 RepID=UPI0021AF766A|nr:hypothetical protein [Pseudomonas protegens]